MTIQENLAIFNSWHLPSWIFLYSPSKWKKSWHNWLLSNWNRWLCWNLAPVPQIVQKIPENYCPRLYLSIGQVWLNELWFKRILSHVQHSSRCHRFGKSCDVYKYKPLNILKTGNKFSTDWKILNLCLR